jgi:hypothetical protein
MTGDIYEVHYNKFGGSETYESELGRFDTWKAAKAERGRIFMVFGGYVRSAWIMRTNPSLDLQPERYGYVLRRDRPQQ